MLTTSTRSPPICAGDVAIEILRRHHGDLVVSGMGRKGRGQGERERGHEPEKCFHDKTLAFLRRAPGAASRM